MKTQYDSFGNQVFKRFNPRIGHIPIKLLAYPKLSPVAKLLWIRLALEIDGENEIHQDIYNLRPESIGLPKEKIDKAFQELWDKRFIMGCMSNTGLSSWEFVQHECLE